ncbi:MAG: site-specific integrase [Chlamydiales bacterium]|nr:site-specific integrase [Chlamydiales bacterium]
MSKFPHRLEDQIHHLNWWQQQYGEKLLIAIPPSLLRDVREGLLNGITVRKTKRTGSTVNRYFSTLSKAFTLAAKEWQWITETPFKRVSKLEENPGRNRFLSKEELNALLSQCKNSKNAHLHGIVLMAASMGMRFGEIVNLRWKNIDFENGLVTILMTKNGDDRVIPLPQQVVTYLQELARPKTQDDFVFPSKNPAKRHPYSMIRKAFQKALQLANIKDFKFRDLRHTCASHLAMGGATQGELMEILGHRSPTMTKRYTHFNKPHIARLLQKTSNQLIGGLEQTK